MFFDEKQTDFLYHQMNEYSQREYIREKMKNTKMENKTPQSLIKFFCLLSFFLFSFEVSGQVSLSTPEEVSGVSVKEMNGLKIMDRDYAKKNDGQPVPQTEDDLWIPDMSLASSPSALAGNISAKADVKKDLSGQTGTLGAAQTAGQDGVQTPSGTEKTLVAAAAPVFNPGFQVGAERGPSSDSARSMTVPVPSAAPRAPDIHPSPLLSGGAAPAGMVSPVRNSAENRQDNWNDAGFASSGNAAGSKNASLDNGKARSFDGNVRLEKNGKSDADLLTNEKKEQKKSSAGADLSECIVSDIRVSGLEMSTSKFNNLIKTRIGSKFNQQVLEEDKRTLLQTRQFVDVVVSTTVVPDAPDKVVVNFDLTQRRLMQYIKVLGNKAFSKSHILEELGMKRGETRLDPYDVENGRLRIIELYKTKGYAEPHVEILRGDRPDDIGVVYLIDEGVKQRVLKTNFVGNTVVSSGHLKHLINAKPGIFYIIGGDFSREILDDDVNKLLEYYRNLGYFDACIDREYEEGEGYTGLGKDNAWITVTFTINEGPRYKIRNIYFAGNKVLTEDKLNKLIVSKKGDFYNKSDIEGDRIKIKNKYHNLGYVLADIVPAQVFTDETGMLDLRYDITEKSRYRVRDILVDYEGEEHRTKSTVIMNMLDIYPGMLLDGEKIKSSEASLRRSGYFNDKPQDGIIPTIKIIPDTDLPVPVKKAEGSKQETKKEADGKVIRGQTRQIPAGFGNTTSYAAPAAGYGTPVGASVSSGVNYSQNTYAAGSNTNSPYADTTGIYNGSVNASAYNQGQVQQNQNQAYNPAPSYNQGQYYNQSQAGSGAPGYGSAQNSVAPVVSGSNASSVTGVDNPIVNGSEVPGFIAASNLSPQGPVFPRTPESERVNGLSLPGDDNIGNADVVAQVREGRTGMIQASIGVNSDYGLVGNVSLTERNFDMFRLPTSLWRADGWTDAFRGGGQIFQIQASPGTDIQRYSVSWDVPYVMNSKYSFGSSATYADRNYTDWFETRYGGELRLGRQWTPRFGTSLYGSIYDVKLTDPLVNYVPDLNEALGKHSLYTLGLSATYDTRNHPFLPSEGGVISGSVEQVLGDYQYPRMEASARKYYTLRKRWDGTGRWILGLKTSAGWMDNSAPIFERFYGGGTTFRGFEYREVTPRYGNTGFGVGGNFEFYASAEMLIPVSGGDEFMLAFFLDTGTVSKTIKDWEEYRVAPGFGFRVSIPMLGPAPLALDFAFPINKAKNDVEQVFSFSVTGSR